MLDLANLGIFVSADNLVDSEHSRLRHPSIFWFSNHESDALQIQLMDLHKT